MGPLTAPLVVPSRPNDGGWLVLCGGGIDSSVVVGWLVEAGAKVTTMHLDYGQKTCARERKSVNNLCRHYALPPPKCARVPLLADLDGNAMLDRAQVLTAREPQKAYVPFRNTVMVSLALAWAEHNDLRYVAIGSHRSDVVCPDNSPDYVRAFQQLVAVARLSQSRVEVVAPLVNLSKAEVVRLGMEIACPLDLTWSCYNTREVACGVCGNCVDRLAAFDGANRRDTIPYSEVPRCSVS